MVRAQSQGIYKCVLIQLKDKNKNIYFRTITRIKLTAKEVIHIISFEPFIERLTSKSFHEPSVKSESKEVISTFWWVRRRNFCLLRTEYDGRLCFYRCLLTGGYLLTSGPKCFLGYSYPCHWSCKRAVTGPRSPTSARVPLIRNTDNSDIPSQDLVPSGQDSAYPLPARTGEQVLLRCGR